MRRPRPILPLQSELAAEEVEDRIHVLIEEPDGALGWCEAVELRQAGYDVSICEGPSVRRSTVCALIEGDRCPLVDRADVVVSNIGRHDGGDELLVALRSDDPDRPIVHTCSWGEETRRGSALDGVHLERAPLFPGELARSIRTAVAERLR